MADLAFDRLTKLLGMLGSRYEGERAAAARKADDLLRDAGHTWSDICELIKRGRAVAVPRRRRRYTHSFRYNEFAEAADACLDSNADLTKWDLKFLRSMETFTRLSEQQEHWLKLICRKCGIEWPEED